MFKKIAKLFAVLFLILLILIGLQPDEFLIERSATINAPAAAVYAEVNDHRRWQEWSPWAKLDPAMTKEFSGPESGVNSTFHWSGNDQVGEGKATIVDSKPAEYVKLNLEFVKPFAATNTAEFRLAEADGKTNVTWSMRGSNNFIAKAVGLFMDCEKMVGEQFETGLTQLKAVTEAKLQTSQVTQ